MRTREEASISIASASMSAGVDSFNACLCSAAIYGMVADILNATGGVDVPEVTHEWDIRISPSGVAFDGAWSLSDWPEDEYPYDDDEPDTDPWEDDPDEAEWEEPTPRWEEPDDEPEP